MSSLDFSITGYFTSVNSFLFPFYTLIFYSYYIMQYFKQNENDNKKVLGSLIIFLFFWNIFFSLIAYLLIFGYFKIFLISFPIWPFAFIIIATSFFRIYSTFLQISFRLRKEALKFFILTSIIKILTIAFSLIFVIHFKLGAVGKLIGILLGEMIVSIISFRYLHQYLIFHFDFKIIKSALKFSFPLFVCGFAHLLITNYDNIVLEKLNNIKEFALYNIGNTISGYLLLMGTSVFQAFEPDIYKLVYEKNKPKLFKYLGLLSILMLICILTFIVSSKFIMAFLTDDIYTYAYKYANVLAVSVFFIVLYSYFSAILLALQKTKEALLITAIVGVAGIFIYQLFTARWEFYGAAYAKILLFILLNLLSLIVLMYPKTSRVFKTI